MTQCAECAAMVTDPVLLCDECSEQFIQMRAIVNDLANINPMTSAHDGSAYCYFCKQSEWEREPHKADCPWVRANDALYPEVRR